MKKSLLLSLLLALCISVTAQNWVTIPDANFVIKLTQLFPQCMDGNLMNTECSGIVNATNLNLNISNISDLTGIEYFVNLQTLWCYGNNLTSLPELPATLTSLNCLNNNLNSLSELPVSLTYLDCSYNNLTTLPELPISLTELRCIFNYINTLPDLPPALASLYCYTNNLTSLPELPVSLSILNCANNNLTSLPELPISLTKLYCPGNNNLSYLPELPPSLTELHCGETNLTSLPELPPLLTLLSCGYNNLSFLPQLPTFLDELRCYNNNLTFLPQLPSTLNILSCQNNQITCLPTLPLSLSWSGNQPSSLYFNISNNPFTCLPNYIPAMSGNDNAVWLTYPLCDLADLVNNPYGCSSFAGIMGTAFNDTNNNCEEDESETGVINASFNLLSESGELLATTPTFGNAIYNFVADTGNYTVQLNTENMPFQISCVDPGTEQDVILSTPSPSALNVDFGVECLPGFDVGVQSVITTGWVFPGQVHTLNITGGDMSSWYGLQCAQGVSGTVTIFVDGPVSYVEPANNSLTPTVTGDLQFTYDIADFSVVNFQEDFALLFETDTTAQAGEQICVDIIVNPIDGDLNPTNNTFNHCYTTVNSYDPNIKQVWPQNVEPGFDDYFNYTIYFQNTGTAPAFNIRLADTLDTNLDLSTFQLTNYSHPVLTYLHGNVLTFRFNNIMLPDSTTDLEGSIGSVQYRIKPIAGLPVGTVIENTAHIFFDFNDAIVTNTTVNEYVIPTSVADISMPELLVFPNPGTGLFNVSMKNGSNSMHQSIVEIYTLRGQRILQQQMNENQTVLDLSTQPVGIYMLRMQNTIGTKTMKLVKQ